MDVGALLTSAGINIGVCVVLFSLYSVLRKQPTNRIVYFGRRLASVRLRGNGQFFLERFVPSPSWIVKAWETTEDEILAMAGLDGVVFLRLLVFSIRAFSIAAIICIFMVLPVNYYGRNMQHKYIHAESLDVFTIGNVEEGSKWLWVHCLALYIISSSTCVLLYFEYKRITEMRLAHIASSPPSPSHFTILVRSIPLSPGESYNDSVKKFFMDYYGSSYLSHQMVYHCGILHKLMGDVAKVCKNFTAVPIYRSTLGPCCLCGASATSFKIHSTDPECPAAFVFFKTHYAAVVATKMLQLPNPMLWVTEMAPEPHDVLWSNLSIPYRQIWLRKIATILAATLFMFIFLVPVTFVQGLTQLDKLSRTFPFLIGLLKTNLMDNLITGYLPSVILMLFLYTVPPTMMLFSSVEGPVSRSERKKSACLKILYFTIWNVFFVNVLSGSVISQLRVFSSIRDIPTQLAKSIPTQATFFITYVLTSGWASLACELMQIFPFLCNLIRKFILRKKEDSSYWLVSFPYHTEVPGVLLCGLIGFTCAIMAPLILPFVLIYFSLAYHVYKNQILNVYIQKYESGGLYWPVIHNTAIFSVVLTQIIALGVFGIKQSPIASGFTVPLVVATLLFNEYCRKRFHQVFRKHPAQVLIEMDRHNELCGKMEEIYQQLHSAYCQLPMKASEICETAHKISNEDQEHVQDPWVVKPGLKSNEICDTAHKSSDEDQEHVQEPGSLSQV